MRPVIEGECGARGLCAVCLQPAAECDGRTCTPYQAPPCSPSPAVWSCPEVPPLPLFRRASGGQGGDVTAEPDSPTLPTVSVTRLSQIAEVRALLERAFQGAREHYACQIATLQALERAVRALEGP